MRGLFAAVFAIGFIVEKNAYYGWNASPQSDAELIADGISLMLCVLVLMGQRPA